MSGKTVMMLRAVSTDASGRCLQELLLLTGDRDVFIGVNPVQS